MLRCDRSNRIGPGVGHGRNRNGGHCHHHAGGHCWGLVSLPLPFLVVIAASSMQVVVAVVVIVIVHGGMVTTLSMQVVGSLSLSSGHDDTGGGMVATSSTQAMVSAIAGSCHCCIGVGCHCCHLVDSTGGGQCCRCRPWWGHCHHH